MSATAFSSPVAMLSRLLLCTRRHLRASAHFSSRSPSVRTQPPARTAPLSRRPRNASPPPLYVHTHLHAALVGRPNVGKSTLFNRLCALVRGRTADTVVNPAPHVFVRSVVDSVPGVTRDPRAAPAALSDLMFTLVDTPGLEDAVSPSLRSPVAENVVEQSSLAAATALCDDPAYRALYLCMEDRAKEAVREANLILFVIDAAYGLTEADRAIVTWLRTAVAQKDVLILANKCDVAGAEDRLLEAYELGFGHPIALSAEHNLGFADLYTELNHIHMRRTRTAALTEEHTVKTESILHHDQVDELRASFDDELVLAVTQRAREEPLQQLIVSIVGRPNVGKSTLMNRLAGAEKSLVGPVAGVTRDAVLSEWKIAPDVRRSDDIPVFLVDTAGVRATAKVEGENLEHLCVKSSLRALRHSHVVVVVLDVGDALCQQDMKLLDVAVTEGRAVVLVVNKMDKVARKELDEWRLSLRYKVDHKVSDLSGVEVVEMSAKYWEDGEAQARRLFYAVQKARQRWEKRVPTSALNRFVQGFNERMKVGGNVQSERRNRIGVTKFISQRKIRPPMFRLDGSSAVSLNYLRSLTNALRKEFGFQGVPIRIKRPSRRGRK